VHPRNIVRANRCQSTIPSARVRYRGSKGVPDRKPTDHRCIETSIYRISAIT